jgi:hypothetical protein
MNVPPLYRGPQATLSPIPIAPQMPLRQDVCMRKPERLSDCGIYTVVPTNR